MSKIPEQHASQHRALVQRTLPFVPVILALVTQAHVLERSFFADDFLHLFKLVNGPLWRGLMSPHGGHMLFSYNLGWWVLHETFGANPTGYFATLLLIHAVNARLVYGLIQELTGSARLGAFGGSLWGMSPFAVGTLGWLSVLGNATATLAILWVLFDLARISAGSRRLTRYAVLRWSLLLLVAGTSFGVGLGVSIAFPIVVFLWNPEPSKRMTLTASFGAVSILLVLLYFLSVSMWHELTGAPSDIPPTPLMIANWPAILVTLGRFYVHGLSGLVLGPLMLGDDPHLYKDAANMFGLGPPIPEWRERQLSIMLGVTAAIGSAALAALFLRSSREARSRILALVAVAGCSYGLVAMTRFWIPSAAQSYRYQYLSTAIIALLICMSVAPLANRFSGLQRFGGLLLAGWIVVMIVPYLTAGRTAMTAPMICTRSNFLEHSVALRKSIEAAAPEQPLYLYNRAVSIIRPYRSNSKNRDVSSWASLFMILYPENEVDGRRVHFVDQRPYDSEEGTRFAGSRLERLILYQTPPGRRLDPGVTPRDSEEDSACPSLADWGRIEK